MKLRNACVVAGLSVLFSIESFAIQPLSDFIASSKRHGLNNKIASLNVVQKDADADQRLYGTLLPSLSGSLGYMYNPVEGIAIVQDPAGPNGAPGATREVTVVPHHQFDFINTIRVPIFDLEAIYRYRSSKEAYEEAKAQADQARQQTAADIAKSYYQYVTAATAEAAVEKRITSFSNLVDVQKSRATIGANFEFDVERAELEVERAKLARAELEAQKKSAKRTLEKLSGLTVVETAADGLVVPTAQFALTDGTIESWLIEVGGLPAVKAAERNAKAQEEALRASQSAYLPKVAATGGNRITNGAGFQQDPVIWSVGVTATINFDLGMPYAQKSQEAATNAAKLRVQQTKNDAMDAIANAYDQIDLQLKRYNSAKSSELLATKSRNSTVEKYAAGNASLLDAFRSEQEVFVVQVGQMQAYAELEYARVLLRITAGKDLSDASALPTRPAPVIDQKKKAKTSSSNVQ